MAVTANQLITRQDGNRRSLPVAASTRIYQGTHVFLTAAGYADDDTATGVNGYAGVAVCEVDNSSGSAGDLTVEVLANGDYLMTGTGFAQADIGSTVYADDNYGATLTLGATSVRIGRIVGYVSSTAVIVSIDPTGTGALETAALTTITHTAPGTPDYALQNLTTSTPYGFVTADEGNTLLSVVKNLQLRVASLESRVA
jgi:hypothetical protein